MKRLGIMLLISLFAGGVQGYWIDFDTDDAGVSPVLESVEMTGTDTLFTLSVPGMEVTETHSRHGDFVQVEIPGSGWLMETGSPRVPVIRKHFIVPSDAEVFLEIDTYRIVTYENLDIWPAQPSYKRSEPEPPFEVNRDVYEDNTLFPGEWARISYDAWLRDFRFVTVEIFPVRTRPVSGTLVVAPQMDIRISAENGIVSYPDAVYPAFYGIYARHFENFLRMGIGQLAEPEPMLIICHDAFISHMDAFVEWKTRRGLHVILVSSVITGTSSSSIRSFIETAWNQWTSRPVYIVLVGDAPQLQPMTGIGNCASDSKFTLLEGNDLVPDAFISRISAGTTTDLLAQLDKILVYEMSPPAGNGGWLDAFSGLASNEGWNPSDEQYSREIESRLIAHNPNASADRIYQSLGHGATQIRNAVNAGRFWVSYFGHGSGTSWYSPSFTNTNVNALTNGSMTPFVMDVSCSNGFFNGSSDCFAERWMKNAGKGAVSMYSSSTVTAWHEPARLALGVTYSVTGNSSGTLPGGDYILGQMTLNGLLYMYSMFGTGRNTEEVMNQYILFGDCSLMFRSDAAATPVVLHPPHVYTGYNLLPVTVTVGGTGFAGAVVCAYKDGDVHHVALTGSNGAAELHVSPATPGELMLTVTGQNLVPYEILIPVTEASPPTPTPEPTPSPTSPPDCRNTGDVNNDGFLTSSDAQMTFLFALGVHSPTGYEACAADCNADGHITAADAQLIFLTVLGMESCADSMFNRPFGS